MATPISVGYTSVDPNKYINPTDNDATPGVGQGISANSPTDVPPVATNAVTDAGAIPPAYLAALESLDMLLTDLGDMEEDPEVLLARISEKMNDLSRTLGANSAELTRAQREAVTNEMKRMIEKAQEQIDAAERKAKKGGGLFGKIFKIIIAIVAVVATIVSCGTLGPLAIAVLVITCVSLANDIVMACSDGKFGLLGGIFKLCGASDETVMKADMAMAIVIVVASLVCCGIGIANAVSAAGTAAQSGTQLAQSVNDVQEIAKTVKTVATIVQAGTMIVDGGIQISDSISNYKSTKLFADAKDSEALALELQALVAALDDMVQKILEDEGEAMAAFADNMAALSEVYADQGDAFKLVGNNIGKSAFAA